MTSIFLTIQIVLAFLLTIVVLFQKSSSIGLGAYSGSNESVFGAKGPTNFLSRLTFIFGFLFVANTITLGYFYNQDAKETVLDSVDKNSLIPSLKAISDKNEEDLNSAPKIPEAEKSENTIPSIPETTNTEVTTPKPPAIPEVTEIYDASTDSHKTVTLLDGVIVEDKKEEEEVISIGEPKE
jgi:preprotein translocase subunit SecG